MMEIHSVYNIIVEFLMSFENDFPLVVKTQLFRTDCTHFTRSSFFFSLLFSFNTRWVIIGIMVYHATYFAPLRSWTAKSAAVGQDL